MRMSDSNLHTYATHSEVESHTLELEEKPLNTGMTRPNIPPEEYELDQSEDNSSTRVRPSPDHFHRKTIYTVVAVAIICSFLAIGLSVYAITQYNVAATELRLARENRGEIFYNRTSVSHDGCISIKVSFS